MMSKEKAELVDRLNAINNLIREAGVWGDPKLEEMRDKVLEKLDFISKREKNNEWRD